MADGKLYYAFQKFHSTRRMELFEGLGYEKCNHSDHIARVSTTIAVQQHLADGQQRGLTIPVTLFRNEVVVIFHNIDQARCCKTT